ncbi:PQQ-dependent sugar dehydrogenase [Pedobacter cryophilus]|uniref:Sorbosone dehydrogenase family protein n=1 Tax=Pedobacter cryophilus TaxID=2571271 RepID=A0A4U1C5F2_9SPHI|nr:sorbosone dehydrogenase family protein [Pedobacter cryophilus]TKC00653.1 sorbosone dehydrogenase family protein [Pedobacter cryophilus]
MKNNFSLMALASFTFLAIACNTNKTSQNNTDSKTTVINADSLSPISESNMKFSNIIGWEDNEVPTAPAGFTVTRFAEGIKSPRHTYITPNGDVLVVLSNSERTVKQKILGTVVGLSGSEVGGKSANTIMLYRDANGDGVAETKSVFLAGLNQPFGMLIIGNKFYVANTDGVMVYAYQPEDLKIEGVGKKIVNLPAGGYNNHWTRNMIANADNTKIYISVGSGSNVGENGMENEVRRANILEVNVDGSGEKIYGSGLRNPVGMDWNPITKELWTAVNERDKLGDDLVPDYITSVKPDGFYGWPYSYFGQNVDPRRAGENPALVAKAIKPDFALAPHSASLGLTFYDGNNFPEKYKNGVFVGQHGSWNRSSFTGYKVIFVPFKDGKPAGKAEDFLTGFVADEENGDVHGRPVGVTVAKDGALLVADDGAGIVWRVVKSK